MKNYLCLTLVVMALGCGKKHAGNANEGSGTATTAVAAGSTGSAASAPAGPPPVQTAEGGAVTALPVVNDCPKSLGGSETVARTIRKECGPIVVTQEYDVDGTLTLEAGVVLKFQDGAELDVGYGKPAKLIVKGTEKEPVVMTSAGESTPGAWGGVRLYSNAGRSQIAHLVVENAGGDKGAMYVDAPNIALTGSTIRNAKEFGLVVKRDGRFTEMSGNTFENAGKVAISLFAPSVGGLGANKFDDGAFVEIEGGQIEENARWQNPGAPYVVTAEVDVNGKNGRATLEIQAGTELRWKDGELDVGYQREATLVVSGTPDKPVVFTAAETKTPGAWHGVWVYDHGEARIANAVFSYGGAPNDHGAVFVHGGTAEITGTTFQDNQRAVNVTGGSTLKAFDHNKLSAGPEPALSIVADQVGGLGGANSFDKDAHIEVVGATLQRSATWLPQTVPYEITGEIAVHNKATLTLSPGIELAFAADQQISVGYQSDATLKAVGTADRPIKLHAVRDDVTWKGIHLYENAFGNELAHLQLTGASGDAGIIVESRVTAKISDTTCAHCTAALASRCGANLTTSGIKAAAGTPNGEVKPDCGK